MTLSTPGTRLPGRWQAREAGTPGLWARRTLASPTSEPPRPAGRSEPRLVSAWLQGTGEFQMRHL